MADVLKRVFGKGAAAKQEPSSSEGKILLSSGEFNTEETGERTPEERQARRAKIISRGFTSISAFGDVAEGFRKSKELKGVGRALDLQARQESLKGAAAAINESIRGNEKIGSQIIASSTSLTGTSGKAISAEFEDVTTNINVIRFSAEQRAALSRDEAIKARRAAKLAKIMGFVKAGERVATGFSGGAGG